MAEPADSTATATLLLNDNRTAVMGRNAAGGKVVVLPTLPDGKTFTAQKAGGTAASGTAVVADASKAAFLHSSTDVETVTVPIDVATPVGGTVNTSKYVRKMLFKNVDLASGKITEKWCYINSRNQPIDATGVATTPALAVDAATTTLPVGAVSGAQPNFSQPGPQPGVYHVTERQQSTGKYIGWTAQKG